MDRHKLSSRGSKPAGLMTTRWRGMTRPSGTDRQTYSEEGETNWTHRLMNINEILISALWLDTWESNMLHIIQMVWSPPLSGQQVVVCASNMISRVLRTSSDSCLWFPSDHTPQRWLGPHLQPAAHWLVYLVTPVSPNKLCGKLKKPFGNWPTDKHSNLWMICDLQSSRCSSLWGEHF